MALTPLLEPSFDRADGDPPLAAYFATGQLSRPKQAVEIVESNTQSTS